MSVVYVHDPGREAEVSVYGRLVAVDEDGRSMLYSGLCRRGSFGADSSPRFSAKWSPHPKECRFRSFV